MRAITWQELESKINSVINETRDELETAQSFEELKALQAKLELARDLLQHFKRDSA
jgi:hypothetical protein